MLIMGWEYGSRLFAPPRGNQALGRVYYQRHLMKYGKTYHAQIPVGNLVYEVLERSRNKVLVLE